jgi:hypothetical protein
MCGMELTDGKDYVFFFHGSYFVSFLYQPEGLTTKQILDALPHTAN